MLFNLVGFDHVLSTHASHVAITSMPCPSVPVTEIYGPSNFAECDDVPYISEEQDAMNGLVHGIVTRIFTPG